MIVAFFLWRWNPAGDLRSRIAAGTAAPQNLVCGLARSFLGTRRHFIARLCGNDFNRITAANLSGFDYAAENPAPPAQRFLKSLPDGVHLVAGFAFLGDFQQSFAGANPLSHGQGFELDAARGDVFFYSPGNDAEFIERLHIHQQQLPAAAATPVNAIFETLVLDGQGFLEFAHRLAMRQRLEQMQHFSHGEFLLRRASWQCPLLRYPFDSARLQNEFYPRRGRRCKWLVRGRRPWL